MSPLAQAELIDEIADRGELRIAVQADKSPYAFKQDDHLTGFDIEFGQELARELDLRAEFVEAPADEVLTGVESGKYDIALTPSSEAPKG
ncbi:transporter substrate-binding domain-containing protein, partial [Pseudomonas sp. SIMBA_064]